ncbi:putative membrane protein [Acinetobacter baumannii 846928]|nr:putative membrane protein [Acinetobacter baumannii 846928]
MLAYWYNAPRHIKLIFIIVVCAAIYAANQVQPLSPTYTVLSLVLGFGLHFGQYLQTKIPEHSSYKLKLPYLLRIYPLIIVAIIMWLLPLNTIGLQQYKL